jgi:hypothetical protein
MSKRKIEAVNEGNLNAEPQKRATRGAAKASAATESESESVNTAIRTLRKKRPSVLIESQVIPPATAKKPRLREPVIEMAPDMASKRSTRPRRRDNDDDSVAASSIASESIPTPRRKSIRCSVVKKPDLSPVPASPAR